MRIILHVDMDAFYAAIEQRDNPDLRGEPVIVGGTEGRGVVATCSYEARPFGVHSAQPMKRALQRCPQATVISPRMSYYAEVSNQIMSVLRDYSPHVETLSLDEAFLDMTGAEKLFGPPGEMAAAIREDIRDATSLTASVGIAKNKFLAKLASDLDKPDGVTSVPRGEEAAFIAPLDIARMWGVGPKLTDTLNGLGIETIGDLTDVEPAALNDQIGSLADRLISLANGVDPRPVVSDSDQKSVGSERTLADNITGRSPVADQLRDRCREVARHLRNKELLAGGLRVKLRYDDNFGLVTRQTTLPMPCDDSESLLDAALSRLSHLDLQRPIRLVGAAAYDLRDPDEPAQLDMFTEDRAQQTSEIEHTMDRIRDRFGDKISRGHEAT